MGDRQHGTVKWFNDEMGRGFITPADGGDDLPTDYKAIRTDGPRTLTEGQDVTFVAERGLKGMQAVEVQPE
ncbi:cold-shock protein [Streptomyces sp. NPDC093111]|uniref:cold shock domain-containing protein n=1 Tax=Streptomyces sp. NPDC093111 TaxID=3154978 RepID=UPI003436DAD9